MLKKLALAVCALAAAYTIGVTPAAAAAHHRHHGRQFAAGASRHTHVGVRAARSHQAHYRRGYSRRYAGRGHVMPAVAAQTVPAVAQNAPSIFGFNLLGPSPMPTAIQPAAAPNPRQASRLSRPARREVVAGGVPVAGAQVGGASYYGGRHRTASGGFVGSATCAHRTLPFGTRVLVTNLSNARQAVLTVNDRGPFVRGRIVDVSVGAAGALGMLHSGVARVSVKVLGREG